MKKLLSYLILSIAAAGMAGAALAATAESAAAYKAAKDNASASYKMARTKCDALSENAKDVCIAEAKAAEKRSKAEAKAAYKNTSKEHMNARIAAADGDKAVAKEKCKALSGNAKDICMKEADATHTKAVADAKSKEKITEVKSEAKQDKHEADYKVAIEKCDSLAGVTKDACVAAAKTKHGK